VNTNHPSLPPTQINFDLRSAIAAARQTLAELKQVTSCENGILKIQKVPFWATQTLRKSEPIAATLKKIGSGSFARRRPVVEKPYFDYISSRYKSASPLQFRLGCGPLKNIHVCGSNQRPDVSEYLMLAQLASFAQAIAALYPYGLNVQIIPDDERACGANGCPKEYTNSYITGLTELVSQTGLSGWLTLEQGQSQICKNYCVASYLSAAEEKLLKQSKTEGFASRWERAVANALQNVYPAPTHEQAQKAAWRYLVLHEAELMSGIWSIGDYFPLRYGRHDGFFQLFTMKENQTQLPWQISLPWPEEDLLSLEAA
jgi:hypothetical protein